LFVGGDRHSSITAMYMTRTDLLTIIHIGNKMTLGWVKWAEGKIARRNKGRQLMM